MTSGTVKWFNLERGFGFIAPNDGGEELFVHHSEIQEAESSTFLSEGETVQFEIQQDLKGPNAIKVKRSFQSSTFHSN